MVIGRLGQSWALAQGPHAANAMSAAASGNSLR
jgi:hypothetical protein